MFTNLKGHCHKQTSQQFRTIVEHACFSCRSGLRVARAKADERLQTRSTSVCSVTRVESGRARFFTRVQLRMQLKSKGVRNHARARHQVVKRAHPSESSARVTRVYALQRSLPCCCYYAAHTTRSSIYGDILQPQYIATQ
eukprot:639909-Pleurochrysis_carterae.AAC.4